MLIAEKCSAQRENHMQGPRCSNCGQSLLTFRYKVLTADKVRLLVTYCSHCGCVLSASPVSMKSQGRTSPDLNTKTDVQVNNTRSFLHETSVREHRS